MKTSDPNLVHLSRHLWLQYFITTLADVLSEPSQGPIQGVKQLAIVFLLVLVSLLTQEDPVMLTAGRQVLLPFHLFVTACMRGGKGSDLFYHARNIF